MDNEPSFLGAIVATAAELLGDTTQEEIARTTARNACLFFGVSDKELL